jgi:hypothetical protein
MLKISLVDSQRQRRLIVEGTLVAPWPVNSRPHAKEQELTLTAANSLLI